MTPITMADKSGPCTLRLLFVLVLLLTAFRVIVLFISDLNLHGDEAQYWSWAQVPAWGYFTKPPMIAWVIQATTLVCGDGEACVRVGSPLLHAGTAIATGLLARELYDERVGFWTGVTIATIPAVSLSSALISTDVPLLLFWTVALLSLVKCLRGGSVGWAILMGVMIGLGFLAKYAMAYFLGCLVLYCLLTKEHRRFLINPGLWLALVIAFVVFLPNLLWNLESGWATFGHLGDNANLKGDLFKIARPFAWLGEQFGVFGPITMGGFLLLAIYTLRGKGNDADRMMLCFSLPIFAVILGQAFLSRANANWAATAYTSAVILMVAGFLRFERTVWLKVSLGLHLTAIAVLSAYVAFWPNLPSVMKSHPMNRMAGWEAVAEQVIQASKDNPGRLVVTDDRKTMASLLYYTRNANDGAGLHMVIRDYDGYPANHYELAQNFRSDPTDRIIFVQKWLDNLTFLDLFETRQEIGQIKLPDHPGRDSKLKLWIAEGYKP